MTEIKHTPVMVKEVIELLAIQPGQIYLDCTAGTGGHCQAILARGGHVYAIDQDQAAIDYLKSKDWPNFYPLKGNFEFLTDLMRSVGVKAVAGVLMDLGTSALQLDDKKRGFSFQKDAPLDMRMDSDVTVTAADLINALSSKELSDIFTRYAQEKQARLLADRIVKSRQQKPIITTMQLASLIETAVPRRSHLHPATKVFQALRIVVNNELNSLKRALPQAFDLLAPQGRLVVISFHQGEDRLVKQFMADKHTRKLGTVTSKKPLIPTFQEIRQNPRSRSAKLRAIRKT